MLHFPQKSFLVTLFLLCLLPISVFAKSPNFQIVAGDVQVQELEHAIVIKQSSPNAVIHWKNVNTQKKITHIMPSAEAIALYRMVGDNDTSHIKNNFHSNGHIYFVATQGLVFHENAHIKAQSIVVSSSDMSNDNFMKGRMIFYETKNTAAQIINRGILSTLDSGRISLAASFIRNEGSIQASSNAKGGTVRLTGDASVTNTGSIIAKGQNTGGSIVLTADNVFVKEKAQLDASGAQGGGTVLIGGSAYGKGPERNAKMTVVEKESLITANATEHGDGGQVIVWADAQTTFDGNIYAQGGKHGGNGGLVETSAKKLSVGDFAQVNTLASLGKTGQWLLDPVDFIISKEGGDISGESLSANLNFGSVVIKSSMGMSGSEGNIYVNDAISWENNSTLTLEAIKTIFVNANITASGAKAGLTLKYGSGGEYNLSMGKKVTLSGANATLRIGGKKYTLIHNVQELQNMNKNLNGYYALGNDIDAGDTKNWNRGEGFEPIGFKPFNSNDNEKDQSFTGTLHGGGHSISHLHIDNSEKYDVGLFGVTHSSSKIYNLGISDSHISGGTVIGMIAGESSANIYKSFVTGILVPAGLSDNVAGGLVGDNSGNIHNSYSSVKISEGTVSTLGGVAGCNRGTILNSYSSGTITVGISTQMAGGLVGWNMGKVINSYSVMKILDSDEYLKNEYFKYGGLIALNDTKNKLINSYYLKNNYKMHPQVGTALTAKQMKKKASFKGWDFDNIWIINEDKTYPLLRNMVNTVSGDDAIQNTIVK